MFSTIFATAFIFCLLTLSIYQGVKIVRAKRGALSKYINANDIYILSSTSLFLSVSYNFESSHTIAALFAILALFYGFLLWLDALLFVQYRIEVNKQTIRWFLTGKRGLSKGLPHLISLPNKLVWPYLILLCWILILILFIQDQFVFSFQTSKIVGWVGFLYYLVLSASYCICQKMHFSHSFFTSPSLITKILKSDKFEDKEFLEIRPEHKKLLKTKEGPLTTSSCFSACKGANVILITMESLGDYIAKDFQKDKVKSRILERFKANAWSSKNHYCLCPNTTVSTNQIYSGGYSNNPYNKESSLFKGGEPFHIKELKKAGYKTLFLDSADISLYDYKKLLDRIGFDKVWGTHDLPSNGHKGDYRLLNMVDDIAHEVGSSPFYLHVINDQTHMPYEVINEDLFSKHKGKTDKTKYLNAVDEVDHIFDEFLNLLEQKIDLFNTIIMFTGDHGESFGEHGYSFHSNSIIQQQMKVPFMMFHPNLQSRIIEHSCHFDIFPTIFDLLGINTSHCFLGNSIALTEREYSYMFYSATLKGNSPANFAFMQNGEMLWVDRLFNQVKIIKDNGKLEELSNEQQDYACAFLKKMLEERNLIS